MANTKHCLVVSLPEGSVKHYLLSAREITIGRGDENSIVLECSTVSSRHCKLLREGGRYKVVDEDSTNGTKLRGRRVGNEPRELQEGDSLVVGLNVNARLVALEEVVDADSNESPVNGGATQKLRSNPKSSSLPSINPVAAAMAKAAKSKR